MEAADIRELRNSLHLTARQFANLIGCSIPTLLRWETSDKPLPRTVELFLILISKSKTQGNVDALSVLEDEAKSLGLIIDMPITEKLSKDDLLSISVEESNPRKLILELSNHLPTIELCWACRYHFVISNEEIGCESGSDEGRNRPILRCKSFHPSRGWQEDVELFIKDAK